MTVGVCQGIAGETAFDLGHCLAAGIVANKRKPIEERQQAMLEARELPRCSLSDFLETQLKACITEDTRLRALKLGRPESEVGHFLALPPPPPPFPIG